MCTFTLTQPHVHSLFPYMWRGETDISVRSHAGLDPASSLPVWTSFSQDCCNHQGTLNNTTSPTLSLPYHYVTCLPRHSSVTCSKRELWDSKSWFCLTFLLRHLQLTKRMHLIRSWCSQRTHTQMNVTHLMDWFDTRKT